MGAASTSRFAVIGNPITHSRSPEIHAAFADAAGITLRYERVLAETDVNSASGFAATVSHLRDEGFRGANVTVPFKPEAAQLANTVSSRAQCGAANTLCFNHDGIHADNTDGVGLVRDIRDNLSHPLQGLRILLLGAGGAARSVIADLAAEKPAVIALANRTETRAQELVADLLTRADIGPVLQPVAMARLPASRFDLVINATSASLAESLPLVPISCFADGALAYDMMYGKGLTPFLALARNAGAAVADGAGMLVEQAAESFFIWHGIRPSTAPVVQRLRVPL